MISPAAVYGLTTGVYAVVIVGLLAWLARLPTQYRKYCYPVVLAVVFSAVGAAADAAGVGAVVVNGTAVAVPTLLGDLYTYSVLWGITALLAGVSRRLLLLAVAIPFTQRAAFAVATVADGAVALVAVLVVVVGHLVLAYLFIKPIWAQAQSVSDAQRLLHWKARNLLLFLIGMIIVFAVLSLTGLFDLFVSAVLNEYMNLLIRVGFAGFLLANVTSIDTEAAGLAAHLGGGGEEPTANPAD